MTWWRQSVLPDGVSHRLIVVRHGEPVPTARGRCYGKLDVDLCDAGVAQAAATGQELAHGDLDHIYTSPRLRASATARVISEHTNTPVSVDERFAELDFGEFEGMTYEAVAEEYPDTYRVWMTTPTAVQFPNGECYADMASRVGAGCAELQGRHSGRAVAVVAHGGVVRIVLARALGLAPANIFRLGVDYASITCIDYYGETPMVRQVNWQPSPQSAA